MAPVDKRLFHDKHRLGETTDNGKSFIETYPDSEAAKILDRICSSIDGKIRKS